jgi:hypothetical protein
MYPGFFFGFSARDKNVWQYFRLFGLGFPAFNCLIRLRKFKSWIINRTQAIELNSVSYLIRNILLLLLLLLESRGWLKEFFVLALTVL